MIISYFSSELNYIPPRLYDCSSRLVKRVSPRATRETTIARNFSAVDRYAAALISQLFRWCMSQRVIKIASPNKSSLGKYPGSPTGTRPRERGAWCIAPFIVFWRLREVLRVCRELKLGNQFPYGVLISIKVAAGLQLWRWARQCFCDSTFWMRVV